MIQDQQVLRPQGLNVSERGLGGSELPVRPNLKKKRSEFGKLRPRVIKYRRIFWGLIFASTLASYHITALRHCEDIPAVCVSLVFFLFSVCSSELVHPLSTRVCQFPSP